MSTAHVAVPTGGMITAGSAFASQSVSNVTSSAPPTIPTVQNGLIVGAMVYVEQAAIRFRVDGTSPSGTFDGNPIAASTTIQVCGSDLLRWRAIASSTGSNAILDWNFYTTGG